MTSGTFLDLGVLEDLGTYKMQSPMPSFEARPEIVLFDGLCERRDRPFSGLLLRSLY